MEMSSKTEEALTHDYKFIVIGGGIAGVTCIETVSFFIKHCKALLLCCHFGNKNDSYEVLQSIKSVA